MSACNSNPGWDGKAGEGKAAVLAESACKCLYEILDNESEFDVDDVLADLDEFKAHQASGGEGSISEKWPEIAKALIAAPALTDKIDGSPCMGEVDEKALEQGVPIEQVLDALDAHCALSIFYN